MLATDNHYFRESDNLYSLIFEIKNYIQVAAIFIHFLSEFAPEMTEARTSLSLPSAMSIAAGGQWCNSVSSLKDKN